MNQFVKLTEEADGPQKSACSKERLLDLKYAFDKHLKERNLPYSQGGSIVYCRESPIEDWRYSDTLTSRQKSELENTFSIDGKEQGVCSAQHFVREVIATEFGSPNWISAEMSSKLFFLIDKLESSTAADIAWSALQIGIDWTTYDLNRIFGRAIVSHGNLGNSGRRSRISDKDFETIAPYLELANGKVTQAVRLAQKAGELLDGRSFENIVKSCNRGKNR